MTLLYILIPLGLLATLAALLVGIANMRKDGLEARRKSNKMMQLRVVAQGATLLVIFLLFAVAASG